MLNIEFVTAGPEHIDRMCEITEQAKSQLWGLGLDQWQSGYPSREIWLEDIRQACAYLAVEEGRILGMFAFQTTPDPSYEVIEGRWLTDGAYASMHRVCVAGGCKGRGIAGKMFAHGFALAGEAGFAAVRIDTHPGDMPMQRALLKAGFEACGRIRLAGGCEAGHLRIGFEKIL